MEDLQKKLFREIPPAVEERIYLGLRRLRERYPAYRDDELLVYWLCMQFIRIDWEPSE